LAQAADEAFEQAAGSAFDQEHSGSRGLAAGQEIAHYSEYSVGRRSVETRGGPESRVAVAASY